MKIGVLGGTFNPIHFGHLRAAEEVREALGLDRVLFVPAKIPPHKSSSEVARPEVRLEMTRRALAGNPHLQVSEIELRREGLSYSVDTLHELRSSLGPADRLWFIVGSDAFREIHTWHRFPEIFRAADILVMRRPPAEGEITPPLELSSQFAASETGFRHESGREVRILPITLLDISSTRIRRALAEGRSIRYLVPDPVLAYLESQEPVCTKPARPEAETDGEVRRAPGPTTALSIPQGRDGKLPERRT